MRKILKALTITLGVLLLVIILVLSGLSLWLNSDSTRQKLFQMGIAMLQEKLETKVKGDSISIELLKGQVRLYGLQVNDRQDSLLLSTKELHVGINPYELLNRKVLITDAELLDTDARLWKDSLTANFQFIIDAFKKKPRKKAQKSGTAKKMELVVDINNVSLQNLHARWDVRHKPRKNLNRPNRGAFDANHVDVMLSTNIKVRQREEGCYDINVMDLNALDQSSQLHIVHLSTSATVSREKVNVKRLLVRLPNSYVVTDAFTIDLSKKYIYNPFTLRSQILLQDLAVPFAPVLSNFSTPLLLTTEVSGPLQSLNVENILIQTPNEDLTLTAHGTLDGLFAKKEHLNLQFRDINLNAKNNMKEQIVMHFAKKMRLKMLRQMKALGDIRFKGTLDVLYKREIIGGRLFTKHGNLTTRFTIDGNTRYMKGVLNTTSFDMGKVMNIKGIGPIKCKIDFNVNISKKTPRPATALPGGRLPMGDITAEVYDAQYSTFSVPLVKLKLVSDGSTAKGNLWIPGDLENMTVQISYVQTDKVQRIWFNMSHNAQQWLLQESVAILKEKLHAEVEADSIDIGFFQGDARLYGIRVRDRQNQPMFSLDSLHVQFNAQQLLANTVHISYLGIHGVKAQLNKDSIDANFHFILDSFKKKPASARKKSVTGKKKRMQIIFELKQLIIDDMQVKWDDLDEPRKNLNRPTRGAFDFNHIDVVLNLEADIKQAPGNGYAINVKRMDLTDRASGLQLDSVQTHAVWSKGILSLDKGLYVKMPQSWVRTGTLAFDIKNRHFLKPVSLSGNVVLQDIAEPFAPVLSNFTTPLSLQALVSGSINSINVEDILINTPDNRLRLTTNGYIDGITGRKENLNLDFGNVDLQTDNETLMQLVMHFAKTVRLKMVRQMKDMGDVHFIGSFGIAHKQETFSGILQTAYGDVNTYFTLDDNTHFMSGFIDTSALEVGKFLSIKRLGTVNAHIDFDFNISSKTPRPATALPNGRLPQGHANAYIKDAKYGILHAKQIEAIIKSDGSTATGSLVFPKRILDFIINYNYIQTDTQQHLKVKPKLKFHWFRKKRLHLHPHRKSAKQQPADVSSETEEVHH